MGKEGDTNFYRKVVNKLNQLSIESGLERARYKGGSRIVMYHGIDLIENKKFNGRFIGIKNFEKQLIYFKKNFNIISLADFAVGNFNDKKFTIAITFDDGYQNNLKLALPLLEKYKIPASFFVTSLNEVGENIIWADFVDISAQIVREDILINGKMHRVINGRFYSVDDNYPLYDLIRNDALGAYELKKQVQKDILLAIKDFRSDSSIFDYWKLLSDNEIKELSKSKYVEIGSHGYYHNDLKPLKHHMAMEEIYMSKKYLENLIQKEVKSIAYPTGSYSRKIIEDSEQIGLSLQLAVNYLYEDDIIDSRILSRFGVYPFYSANMLGHILAHKKK